MFNRSASLSLKEARPSSMSRSDVKPSSLVKVVSLVRGGPCSFGRGCTWIYLTHFFIVFVFQASNRSSRLLYDIIRFPSCWPAKWNAPLYTVYLCLWAHPCPSQSSVCPVCLHELHKCFSLHLVYARFHITWFLPKRALETLLNSLARCLSRHCDECRSWTWHTFWEREMTLRRCRVIYLRCT